MIDSLTPSDHRSLSRSGRDDARRTAVLEPVAVHAATADVARHLENIVANLPLIADMGYASVTLAVPDGGSLTAIGATRTITAVGPVVEDRIGTTLDGVAEDEAYTALASGEPVVGTRIRERGEAQYLTMANPVLDPGTRAVVAVIVRDIARTSHETPGRMEENFIRIADELVQLLCRQPLHSVEGAPFSTLRRPGDGVMRIDESGEVSYPSPNAVAIMRRAGYEERVRTSRAAELPGGGFGIVPALGTDRAIQREVSVGGRSLLYRTIGLPPGAFVLVEDITEAREQEAKLRVREATIREVHHRVKNNLQTVASLLRMQARRVDQDEAREALVEATGRVESMAAVHTLLAYSDFEQVDLYDVIEAAVASIKRGVAGESKGVRVDVTGERDIVLESATVSSLAMVVTELVHNALYHGLRVGESAEAPEGSVLVAFELADSVLRLSVSDSGLGLPPEFELGPSSGLGLSIVQTIVNQDLGGRVRVDRGLGSEMIGARFEVEVPV